MVNGVNFLFEQGLTSEELDQAMDLLDVLSEQNGQEVEIAPSDDEALISARGVLPNEGKTVR